MEKSITMFNMHTKNSLPVVERWLYKDHAPDMLSKYGAIMTQYDTYRATYLPNEMKKLFVKYGTYNWRVENQWWSDLPTDNKGNLFQCGTVTTNMPADIVEKVDGNPYVADASGWKGDAENHPPVCVFLPYRHDNDFKGRGTTIYDFKSVVRWVVIFKYPEGVSEEEGEKWFLETFAPEAAKQKGLVRFISTKIDKEINHTPFVRVAELWYENLNDWKDSVVTNPPAYTKPEWASEEAFPFLKPYEDFVGIFLDERPECNYLRELGPYVFTA